MLIIGISGKKQAGKTTIAEALRENHKRLYDATNIHIISFADALKEEVAKACGVTVQFIEEHKDIFRPILQWWGTEFRRNLFGQDYWIIKLFDKVSKLNENSIVLIPDVRFINEADSMASIGGKLWRIDRIIDGVDTHPSETELDNYKGWDKHFMNVSTLEWLIDQSIRALAETIQQHNREHPNK